MMKFNFIIIEENKRFQNNIIFVFYFSLDKTVQILKCFFNFHHIYIIK